MIALAHTLGLTVTAESVETADQFAQLRELGCDTGQGWFFAVPVPAEQIPRRCSARPLGVGRSRSRRGSANVSGHRIV